MKKRGDRMALYDQVSLDCSRGTARAYSTSFFRSIRALAPDLRGPIYAIYGFVRLADEVVDSFQGYDQDELFARLRTETFQALDERISTNPILHAFQQTFHQYSFEREHVEQFLRSMEWDLEKKRHDRASYETYIVGSAEVVGLMCLKVFVRGDQDAFRRLRHAAEHLGAAFQKVNFLRDIREDYQELGRSYFPNMESREMDQADKERIESEIEEDLRVARKGIAQLPRDTRFGVYLAYTYYRHLLRRIRNVSSQKILETRVRVPDAQKAALLVGAYARHRLDLV